MGAAGTDIDPLPLAMNRSHPDAKRDLF